MTFPDLRNHFGTKVIKKKTEDFKGSSTRFFGLNPLGQTLPEMQFKKGCVMQAIVNPVFLVRFVLPDLSQ